MNRLVVEYNRLIKNVENLVEAIEDADDVAATVRMVADAVISQFRDQLGLYGGRIYRREGDEFVLQGTFGEAKEVPEGLRVSAELRADPGADSEEDPLHEGG